MKPKLQKYFPLMIACALVAVVVFSKLHAAPPFTANYGAFVRLNHLATDVSSPSVITVTTNAQTLFSERLSGSDGRVLLRTMQNTGTKAVIFAIGSTVSLTNYHGILAAGSVARDGLGSVVDLRNWRGTISVMTETGTSTVSLMEMIQ